MFVKTNWWPAGLIRAMAALLLLVACGGAGSTGTAPVQSSAEALSASPAPALADQPLPSEVTTPAATPPIPGDRAPSDAAVPTVTSSDGQEYQIVTLLPPDAIPAIDDPEFYAVAEADTEYAPEELILGVELDGEARAYSVSLLSRHEIVNDTLAGHPIAITW